MQLSLLHELPGADADVWDWQSQGRCRGRDSSVFFSEEGERTRARRIRERQAKEICRTCPVIAQCRAHALNVAEPFGVWGGLSESDRILMLRQQGAKIVPGYRPGGGNCA